MSDDPNKADLEAFIRKALDLQLADHDESLSEDQLKGIAERAGIGEDDWNRLCEVAERKLKKGLNFLSTGNYADAIPDLEEAAALAPYRPNVLHDCGRAHLLRWQGLGDRASLVRAEELFRNCLRIDAAHAGAAEGIARLKESLRKRSFKVRLVKTRLVAIVVSLVALIGGLLIWNAKRADRDLEAPSLKMFEAGVREYGQNRYLLVRIPMTRDQASDYCRKLGGKLVTVDSRAENRWLYETFGAAMAREKKNAWLGVSDAKAEGNWIWEDGRPAEFQNWAGGGPNNKGDEDSAVMVATSDEWNDAPAARKWWFFCEWETWPPDLAPDLDMSELKASLRNHP